MYKLSSEKDTPEKIISDLQNYRISRDEAIKRINLCIETSINNQRMATNHAQIHQL